LQKDSSLVGSTLVVKNDGAPEWASAEALAAWRENPEHRKAQERGRQAFYAEYEISVCKPLHEYSFKGGQRSAQ